MEEINYITEMIWLLVWPALIFVSYKFIALNMDHFEEFINR